MRVPGAGPTPRKGETVSEQPEATAAEHEPGDFAAAAEPFALFDEWLADAARHEPNDPTAMALAASLSVPPSRVERKYDVPRASSSTMKKSLLPRLPDCTGLTMGKSVELLYPAT